MWRTFCAGLIVATGLVAGCDKNSDTSSNTSPPSTPAAPDTASSHAAQLTERIKLVLRYDPLSLMVPPSWQLKTLNDGAVVVIEGDTPTDTVAISLPAARTITSDSHIAASIKLKAMEDEARANAAKYPDLIKGDVVRDIPGAHIIENLTVDAPVAATQAANAEPIQSAHWIITVCVPSGRDYMAYELRFMGLTVKTYKADRDFLRSIVDSLSYTPPPPDMLK